MEAPEFASLVVAGAVLPVASIAAVLGATVTYGLNWVVPLFLLLVSPISAALGLYGYGVRTGSLRTPRWLPVGGRRTARDRIPDRHREAFGPAALGQSTTDDSGPSGRTLALVLVYLVSIPVYALLFWGLFG